MTDADGRLWIALSVHFFQSVQVTHNWAKLLDYANVIFNTDIK
jgi:hypothetical protein